MLLQEVRLQANIETGTTNLLPLVLVGQAELAELLDGPTQGYPWAGSPW